MLDRGDHLQCPQSRSPYHSVVWRLAFNRKETRHSSNHERVNFNGNRELHQPFRVMESPVKTYSGWIVGVICSRGSAILVKAPCYMISTELPLSIRIRCTVWLLIIVSITRASFWGKCTPRVSSFEKMISTADCLDTFGGLTCRLIKERWMFSLASLAYCFWDFWVSPPIYGPPVII